MSGCFSQLPVVCRQSSGARAPSYETDEFIQLQLYNFISFLKYLCPRGLFVYTNAERRLQSNTIIIIFYPKKTGLHCRLNTLKIEDRSRLPCWNFAIAIYSLNCCISNTQENTSNLVKPFGFGLSTVSIPTLPRFRFME